MNKQKFLKKLTYELRKLKKDERKKYIDYYDEIISDIMESGVSEEDAIKKQGSAKEIAREILSNTGASNLRARDWKGITLSILSVCLLLICIIPALIKAHLETSMTSMSATIGIIGGADGPTSIFIAGKLGTPWGLYIATAVLVIATIVYFVRKGQKR